MLLISLSENGDNEFAKIELNWLVLLTYLEQFWYTLNILLSIAEKQIKYLVA